VSVRIGVLPFGSDRIDTYVTSVEARRLLTRNHAQYVSAKLIRLTAVAPRVPGEFHASRTRISSGGVLAAIGMSQIYTRGEIHPGKVDGYKFIDPVDRAYFTVVVKFGTE
jgi:hypothetical protein